MGAWRVGVCGVGNLLMFAQPEGRMHFAGEHLSFSFSWMQGALESAARVVNMIHEAPEGRAAANRIIPYLLESEILHRTLKIVVRLPPVNGDCVGNAGDERSVRSRIPFA